MEEYSEKKYKFITSEDGYVIDIVEDGDDYRADVSASTDTADALVEILWNEYGDRRESRELRLISLNEDEEGLLVKIANPSIDLLLKHGLQPSILTAIAKEKCKEMDESNQYKSHAEEAAELAKLPIEQRVSNLVNEMLFSGKKIEDFEEHHKSILKMWCLGRFESPNASNFKSFVRNELPFIASTTNTPPSSWGSFENVRGKVVAYDLDMAFYCLRSSFITRTMNNMITLASKVLLFPVKNIFR